jgi:hypothetical protein
MPLFIPIFDRQAVTKHQFSQFLRWKNTNLKEGDPRARRGALCSHTACMPVVTTFIGFGIFRLELGSQKSVCSQKFEYRNSLSRPLHESIFKIFTKSLIDNLMKSPINRVIYTLKLNHALAKLNDALAKLNRGL